MSLVAALPRVAESYARENTYVFSRAHVLRRHSQQRGNHTIRRGEQ